MQGNDKYERFLFRRPLIKPPNNKFAAAGGNQPVAALRLLLNYGKITLIHKGALSSPHRFPK